jgi:hypothetical protein
MEKIYKEINLCNGLILKIIIDDGIAILSGTYGKEILKFYYQAKEQGKKVVFDYRKNVMIEYYDGLKANEIEKLIDQDIKSAKEVKRKVK